MSDHTPSHLTQDELKKLASMVTLWLRAQEKIPMEITFAMGTIVGTALRLQAERDKLIETLIQQANIAADCMEGQGEPEFTLYETRMCIASDTLKILGINYDPITGQREEIP